MSNTREDTRKIAVWVAMANHFLDTETRQDIPRTALCCVEAGLSPSEVSAVWRYEVTPAVGFNLHCVAGEWAGWDRDWLLDRILSAGRNATWLAPRSWFARLQPNDGLCEAIARCVALLSALPSAVAREQLVADLTLLTSHYFDFCPAPLAALDSDGWSRLRALFEGPFRPLLESVLVSGEASVAQARVLAALQGARA